MCGTLTLNLITIMGLKSFLLYYLIKFLRLIITPEPPTLREELPIFDAECWRKYLNYQMEDVPKPEYLQEILDTPCPFWPDKLIKHTHLVLLVPKGFTAKKLWALADKRLGYPGKTLSTYSAEKNYWIIITRKCVPKSRMERASTQIEILAENGYCAPAILEIAIAIQAMRNFKKNSSIFPFMFGHTRCYESMLENYEGYMSISDGGSYPFGMYTLDYNRPGGMAGVFVLGYAD